ncbi:MAG: DUF2207 domain-containing protein, partial [Acidobacteria bacterium]|nr:DUF2207 domain-containing protein [Acidobacteriota bacterium]
MVKKYFAFIFLILFVLPLFSSYRFEVVSNYSTVEIKEDSKVIIRYTIIFKNYGDPIDIVDIGLPDNNYDINSAEAFVNGNRVRDIRKSTAIPVGVEVHLLEQSIAPGKDGALNFSIVMKKRIYQDDKDPNYASVVFMTTYFGSEYTQGSTRLGCQFIFPKGVRSEEPRYHNTPYTEALVGKDGRVIYRWLIENASPSQGYTFGASFPKKYVKEVVTISAAEKLLNSFLGLISSLFQMVFSSLPCFCFAFFIGTIILGIINGQRRKMQYLPASVGMDGVEIRRGLTVPEVAALMEEPLNKVLALVLFGMIRKGYIKIISQKPWLKLEKISDKEPDLSYEKELLKAISDDKTINQNEARDILVDLVKRVQEKMKGFSRKKTLLYYKEIMKKAWEEVGKDNYEESFEWLLADKDFKNEAVKRYPSGNFPIPISYGPIFGHTSTASTGNIGTGSVSTLPPGNILTS